MLIAYIGDRGSGKSLSMVRNLFYRYKKGTTIYTNMNLKFPKFDGCGKVIALDFKNFMEKFKKKDFKLSNCVVVLDEIHVFIDSRRSMSSRNLLFNKFITQSRKRSVDVIYTTQDLNIMTFLRSGQVDLRTRKLTERIIYCKTATKFYKKQKPIINYEDMINPEKDKMYCMNYIYDTSGTMKSKSIFLGNSYMPYYDSDEIIDFFDF